ncbi:MAG TPA: hypothetical protein VFB22_04815 [Candidatus Baltobacteraceae bacterium]|nr:hypothetical protein [Candidatus Baltobacteraceae bacterium]
MRRTTVLAACCAALLAAPSPALAWGALGHQIINGAAMRALPATVPAFLRTAGAHDTVRLLGPEPDRIKGSGAPLDDDESPAHYLDALDDGTIDGVVRLDALPRDEAAYERALEQAPHPTQMWIQGYLPYAIADGWEHVVRDFAYWRVDVAGERAAQSAQDRAFFAFDRGVREALTLRDIGYWGHFVADGSQPLHVSVHFNGWNDEKTHTNYPNPNGFSDSKTIHARFETSLVRAVATEDLVAARLPAPRLSSAPILAQTGAYLLATESFVPAVYRLEAAGGIDADSPAATSLVLDRLAAGAAEMRDLIVEAWQASDEAKVGYPGIAVRDVESGAVRPTRANVGLGD